MPPLVKLRVLVLSWCCLVGATVAEPRPYIVDVQVAPPAKGGNYYIELLTLLLNASKASNEIIKFRFFDNQLSQARWIAAVAQDNGNNVLWTMTSNAREEILRPIRVPLLKGLMGYRLLVIRKGDETKFAHVKTKQDLLALSAGQGMHWPDTDILRANKFQLVEATAKENLYKMLSAKRFDFFPRGITEVYLEEDLIRAQNLTVESHLLLHYPTDLYFFVSKQNTELASRLEKGWAIIHKNGEFEKFFLSSERVKDAIAILKSHRRTVIELENPFLPQNTPLSTSAYWLDINKAIAE